MNAPILYVTGTNTGVGKTTLSVLLLRQAHEQGLRVGAMKPFCSGGREDAIRLHRLQTSGLLLDEVNPFFFDEPVTPLIAARNAGRKISLDETLNAIQAIRREDVPLLIEGAGGLLSPLGEGFSLRDVIEKIPGKVCIVGTNALGTLNLTLLTARQLPVARNHIAITLMNPALPDSSSSTNLQLLAELLPEIGCIEIPFLEEDAERTDIKKMGLKSLFSTWLSGGGRS